MCLAIPMRVLEIKESPAGLLGIPLAVVDADGLRREVRLDLIGQQLEVGDYLIIHAGFAMSVLSEKEALENLQIMRELAENMEQGNFLKEKYCNKLLLKIWSIWLT